jgi:hypothetical protein
MVGQWDAVAEGRPKLSKSVRRAAFVPFEGEVDIAALHLRLWRAAAPANDAAQRRTDLAGKSYLSNRRPGSSPTVLFDSVHYASQLPWFVRENTDPLDHYLRTGWSLGLSPHAAFDVDHLAELLRLKVWTQPPLLVYFELQNEVSAHPLFDVDVYARHADIESIPFARLFECFIDWSDKARAPFSRLFSVAYYAKSEPVARFGTINPLIHYLTMDPLHRRDANPMLQSRWYDGHYPAKPGQPADPLIRFARIGLKEGHLPNPFSRQQLKVLEADAGVAAELLMQYVDVSGFDFYPDRTTSSHSILGIYDSSPEPDVCAAGLVSSSADDARLSLTRPAGLTATDLAAVTPVETQRSKAIAAPSVRSLESRTVPST